ncbi:GntP family permease [Lignipirellula cremea]|uniref:Citrate transporter n=1 Tax=Lignipirellula cremea TaxID=2528010 RepID=A0A518E0H2_9BACT|nr:GntP family permease [Lignipirellula cremea]QDU97590.1 Citrate transporter [Lignipirellula cremea]
MSVLITIAALALLMFVAYRGFSVILFAPLIAMLAVLCTDPSAVMPVFSGVFMEKMVGFVKIYFPVFLLGALFGKWIELSGFSAAVVTFVIKAFGPQRTILSIVAVCGLLTYGGVSLFVVVFAVYPFAAEMFRKANIPKRLIPGTIALGAFTFSMDALPGSPQIQNIIPTTYFNTTAWAAPWLGLVGAVFILLLGLGYLEWRRISAARAGEGYLPDEPQDSKLMAKDAAASDALAAEETHIHPLIALLPLVVVGVANLLLTEGIARWYDSPYAIDLPGLPAPLPVDVDKLKAVWAVEGALVLGILTVTAFAWPRLIQRAAAGSQVAVGGALLAAMNTAAEYGFGGVIAILPGFQVVREKLQAIPDPLVNEAITVTTLAGITGSASGGLSIALASMAEQFKAAATAAEIPFEVLHRVASMAAGGMDTLPHNGAVITLLAVTGLTHRDAYRDIFAVTCIKTLAVFFIIAVYYATGLV